MTATPAAEPDVTHAWHCIVEYDDHTVERFGPLDEVEAWARAEAADELWVWSCGTRTYERR